MKHILCLLGNKTENIPKTEIKIQTQLRLAVQSLF